MSLKQVSNYIRKAIFLYIVSKVFFKCFVLANEILRDLKLLSNSKYLLLSLINLPSAKARFGNKIYFLQLDLADLFKPKVFIELSAGFTFTHFPCF